jgi:catechol 2,3-dioxygenase-like lactoylglutathione lyase family enzyme
VWDIAFPRLQVPDLDVMEKFLTDFGMTRSARTDTALYMRGAGPAHHLHVSEVGEPALVAVAFEATRGEDLDTLAAATGAAVEDTGEPGGGRRVVLTDPNGLRVEVVYGIEKLAPIEHDPVSLNLGSRVERQGNVTRVASGPSRVLRLGHGGINVVDLEGNYEWYHRHLGIVKTDVVGMGGMDFGYFCHCDRGADYADHHNFLLARSMMPGESLINHFSWEVVDVDDIFAGHHHLAEAGHRHNWGIGRHTLGSQLFDYWRDPWGQIHEHYTDGDLVNEDHEVGEYGPDGAMSQWGPQMPPDFGRVA